MGALLQEAVRRWPLLRRCVGGALHVLCGQRPEARRFRLRGGPQVHGFHQAAAEEVALDLHKGLAGGFACQEALRCHPSCFYSCTEPKGRGAILWHATVPKGGSILACVCLPWCAWRPLLTNTQAYRPHLARLLCPTGSDFRPPRVVTIVQW